ncbi:MAG: ABC transporter ATP-binding protein [Catonella sp.]|nr:ABC transporter ATP-binding protein [Catonella sp.]MDY6356112.1 ABC transporter ATP-binding protein [Catonella sp.]
MIHLDNLKVSYGERLILSIDKKDFTEGSVTAILGKNGCGKTTFLKAIAGNLAYRGKIEVDGKELSEIPFAKKARIIGYLPQAVVRADMTVSMLVAHGRFPWKNFPRKLDDKDLQIINDAMNTVGISSLAEKNLKEISGGELKLSYLAMLLAQDTKVLLLDEPEASLDVCHQEKLYDVLKNLAGQGRIVLHTSHDVVKSVNYSDRICVIDKGSIALDGAPDIIAKEKVRLYDAMGVAVTGAKQDDSLYKYIYGKVNGKMV